MNEIGLNEFVKLLLEYNEAGNKFFLEHKEKFPYHTSKKKQEKTGYHPPATKADCEDCKKIIENYDKIQELEKKHFGLVNIPVDGLISAIKVTKATIEMMRIDEVNKDGSGN